MPLLQNPHWPFLIDLYFFLVGLAGGAFMVAGIADLFGEKKDREVTRVGAYLTLLALIPGPIFLIVDLGMPSRFLHMLWSAKDATTIGEGVITVGGFHLKVFSPMNLGAWALLGFGVCAFVAALAIYLEDTGKARDLGPLRGAAGGIGAVLGFFVAGYPGQLLSATARPFWTDARPMGALFLAVGATTGMAAVALILSLRGPQAASSLAKIRRAYTIALVVQILALIAVFVAVSGGPAWSAAGTRLITSGPYSLAFWLGVVILGLAAPLALEVRDGFFQGYRGGPGLVVLASVLILLGGFLTKYLLFAAGQAL